MSLVGIGASAGIASGAARVITRVDDLGLLEPDELLVCTQTDPAWTPFFVIAAGVVVEIGGAASVQK